MKEHPLIILTLLFSVLVGIALGCGIVLAIQALNAEATKAYQIAEKYRMASVNEETKHDHGGA